MSGTSWEHATWIDFFERSNADVEYFCVKFSGVLKFEESMFDSLYEEFLDFRTLHEDEIPGRAFEEALVREYSDSKEYRMDVI